MRRAENFLFHLERHDLLPRTDAAGRFPSGAPPPPAGAGRARHRELTVAQTSNFNAGWLAQESPVAAAPNAAAVPGRAAVPTPADPGAAVQAEQAVVSELLQIARTVLTLEITFEAGAPGAGADASPAPAPAPTGTGRFDMPVVLRDGQVYGTLRCVSDDRRTPVGSRPADALRCVAVLVGRELDRHRRRAA